MIQHTDEGSASILATLPLEQAAALAEAEPVPARDEEDWNSEDSDWRRTEPETAAPGLALIGLSPQQIRERHIRMLNELVEQTHPLASEFLATAHEISPAAQGRDKLVNAGCKLAGMTNQLITTSSRLAGG